MLRGGAYKPRTSPYAFQGLGVEGLKMLRAAADETGLPVVTEVLDVRDAETVAEYADVLQVGARNMQNFMMLDELGKMGKPVLLKRGLSATIEELCRPPSTSSRAATATSSCASAESGPSRPTRATRSIWPAVAALKQLTHLPVIVDPSHATGRRDLVAVMSRAAVVAGADGVMVEVHPDPEHAKCDGPQSLDPPEFEDLMSGMGPLMDLTSKTLGWV